MNKHPLLTRTPIIALLAFICCALWGSAIPMIKTGYRILSVDSSNAASQVLFGGMRFVLAGILVLFFACLREKKLLIPDRSIVKYASILCLAQTTGQYFFFYIGVANSTGVAGGILSGMGNFFAIIISCLIVRSEKMTGRKCLGCALAFLGILVINLLGGGETGGFKLIGEGFILFSGICYGISACLIRSFSKHASPVILSGCQFFLGGLLMMMIGLGMGGSLHGFTLSAVAVLCYLAFVSAAAYTIWSLLLVHNPVSQVSIYGFINPICSVMLSALILGEYAQVFQFKNLAALALVCLGIYVINCGDRR